MKNPTQFLLEKILSCKTNGHEDLGHLNAKHINSIAAIMQEFAEDTAIEVVTRLSGGNPVQIRENLHEIKKAKARIKSPKLS